MADCMEFPKTITEFLHDYSFKDEEEIIPNILYDIWYDSKIPLLPLDERKKNKELENKVIAEYLTKLFNNKLK